MDNVNTPTDAQIIEDTRDNLPLRARYYTNAQVLEIYHAANALLSLSKAAPAAALADTPAEASESSAESSGLSSAESFSESSSKASADESMIDADEYEEGNEVMDELAWIVDAEEDGDDDEEDEYEPLRSSDSENSP